jgi:hypothetical protein
MTSCFDCFISCFFIYYFFYLFNYFEMGSSLSSLGWPQSHSLSALASQVLGLQVCITVHAQLSCSLDHKILLVSYISEPK